MKDSTLVQEEDSTGEDTMERLLKEYMGLFKDIDSEGDEEYAAYFTDGDDMLVCETLDNDKDNAEWVLKQVLYLYWLKKSSCCRIALCWQGSYPPLPLLKGTLEKHFVLI